MATTFDITSTGAHSCVIQPRLKSTLSDGAVDKYGRMFPNLPGLEVDEEMLLALD